MPSKSPATETTRDSVPPAGFGIWNAARPRDRAAWEKAWEEAASGDFFCHPAYLAQFAAPGQSSLCAHYSDGRGSQVIYGFLTRPITADACGNPVRDEVFDITAPLLYGGPLGRVAHERDPQALSKEFWEEFRAWARSSGAVSEFIRMNPASAGHLPYPGALVEQAPHVVRTLSGHSEEQLWSQMSKSARRNVRKARAAGMETVLDRTGDRVEDFLRLYHHTMERTGAAERFHYPREFFEALHTAFQGRFAYLYAVHQGRPVSAELMLLADEVGYSFLGATDASVMHLGTNTLVSFEAFLHARAHGVSEYVLTGGVTNSHDDSLLSFKRSLAAGGSAAYYTGQQIFDHERYAQLTACTRRTRSHRTAFFPAYRDSAAAQRCAGLCRSQPHLADEGHLA